MIVPEMTRSERIDAGRQARKRAPRTSHAVWEPFPERPDPVALLEGQAVTRVPELVPIRYGRMSAEVVPVAVELGGGLQGELSHVREAATSGTG